MSDDDTQSDSGTRFPFINLEKAAGRAQELYDADQRGREMATAAAFGVWGYSEKSSGGFQTIAALKMYGLIRTNPGKLALTDAAMRYFRDERDEERQKLLREFALKPKLIAALWKDWHVSPPADTIARSHLKTERGLTDQSARSLLAIYKENLSFASLTGADKPVEETVEKVDTQLPPGGGKAVITPPAQIVTAVGKVKIMPGERELTTGILSKEANFRLIVSGPIGVKEIERLIAKLTLDKDILAEIDFVEGSWHFLEFTSDMAEQEVSRFASALRSKFNASGMPDDCAAYRKQEAGSQLVFLNPAASQLVAQMPLWASTLQSINVGPDPDLSAFKKMGVFD